MNAIRSFRSNPIDGASTKRPQPPAIKNGYGPQRFTLLTVKSLGTVHSSPSAASMSAAEIVDANGGPGG